MSQALKKILKNLLNEYGTDEILLALGEVFQHNADEAIEAEEMEDARIWLDRSLAVRKTAATRKQAI